jgi:hypothetical protein
VLHAYNRKAELMKYWGIYVAFAWLATISLGVMDAALGIRKDPQLQPLRSEPTSRNKLGA